MDNKTSFDRSLFIPILIGIFSVMGICLVLLALRLNTARVTVEISDTATPLKFQYLATEPGIVFPTDAPSPTAEEPPTPIPPAPTEIPPSPTSIVIIPTTATFTSAPTISPTAGTGLTFDDADTRILYTGSWLPQTGVSNTYKNTLHISISIGNSAILSFSGQKLRLVYQAGPSLGTVAIRLDSAEFVLDQSASETRDSEWESPTLSSGNHTITITHISGGSINIDSIAIIAASTPTPSITPTP